MVEDFNPARIGPFPEATGAGRCWGQESYGGSCSTLDFTGVTDVWAAGMTWTTHPMPAVILIGCPIDYPALL